MANSDAINNALMTLEGRAIFDSTKHELYNRVALIDNTLWYDLANNEWQAIKITANGWEIVAEPPILFKRYSHLQSQLTPKSGGDVRNTLSFVNISDPDQKILFLVCLTSNFIPGFAHPIPYIYGQQGSAKSTLSKILRKLIDPSKTEVLSLPKNNDELIQVLAHHYFLCFDNVSLIPDSTSDLL